MNHKQAFLQAIREAPHDDAPRLIYADWLEEQGGAARTARANFIRIQCRLAELPDDDPARDALEDDAADLLAEYEGEWTQPLHGLVGDWRFSRGFVERITIGAEKWLTHAESLFDFAPLRCLHFLIHARDVPHLAACEQLQWIETLDFRGCHLNDRALQQLLTSPHLERLTALNLSGNGINTPGLRALVQSSLFARLRCLDLSRNIPIGDTAARLLARATPASNLEVLNLGENHLTIDGLVELFRSTSLPHLTDFNASGILSPLPRHHPHLSSQANFQLPAQLRRLDLGELRCPVILPALLRSLSSANLRALYLYNITASKRDVELLAKSPSLANLSLLDLHRNNLGAVGVASLADSPHMASLTHLNLSHNNIRDTGAKVLASSAHLTRLRKLNLTGNGIGGPGLKALAESANLDHLRTLSLSGNFIGADSVRALAESEHLRSLTWLDLSDAFLEEDSARAMVSSANLTRLRTLLLKKNLLGDGGVRALARSPHLARLTTLDLNDNRIGKAGAEALAAAAWRRMRSLDLRGNVFTDTQEVLLRNRFGNAVQL
ncbi:MAG TPA: TIGR02996 domain-containing protein [Gemmataceae bacterium]|nr:TIGR02996 domain-containing protein [Gemmataceae bacterium]